MGYWRWRLRLAVAGWVWRRWYAQASEHEALSAGTVRSVGETGAGPVRVALQDGTGSRGPRTAEQRTERRGVTQNDRYRNQRGRALAP